MQSRYPLLRRFQELVALFPQIVLIVAVVAIAGQKVSNLIIILGLTSWPPICRLIRGQFLAAREFVFVEAAQSIGVRDGKIMGRHIFPNVLPPVIV